MTKIEEIRSDLDDCQAAIDDALNLESTGGDAGHIWEYAIHCANEAVRDLREYCSHEK